jgi:hypothetical protein
VIPQLEALERLAGQRARLQDVVLRLVIVGLGLILVDDFDAPLGPAQGNGVVGQGLLPLAGFAVFEDLVGRRLTHVDDGQTLPMTALDFAQAKPERGRRGDGLRRLWAAAILGRDDRGWTE